MDLFWPAPVRRFLPELIVDPTRAL